MARHDKGLTCLVVTELPLGPFLSGARSLSVCKLSMSAVRADCFTSNGRFSSRKFSINLSSA
eukprot:1246903-Amphidinium_carterae.1